MSDDDREERQRREDRAIMEFAKIATSSLPPGARVIGCAVIFEQPLLDVGVAALYRHEA